MIPNGCCATWLMRNLYEPQVMHCVGHCLSLVSAPCFQSVPLFFLSVPPCTYRATRCAQHPLHSAFNAMFVHRPQGNALSIGTSVVHVPCPKSTCEWWSLHWNNLRLPPLCIILDSTYNGICVIPVRWNLLRVCTNLHLSRCQTFCNTSLTTLCIVASFPQYELSFQLLLLAFMFACNPLK